MKIICVIPVYNEQDSLETLYYEIKKVVDRNFFNYEGINQTTSPLGPIIPLVSMKHP